MGNNYLRKTRNKVKKQPNNRGVRKGIDGSDTSRRRSS